jgi:threonine synthase
MGLPIEMFIASTNLNDIMPTYIKTGIFTAKPSVATISNAMDVGNPSNYPRVIELYNKDIEALRKDIIGKVYTDAETAAAVKSVYQATGYVMDPHSAVGYLGLKEYFKESGMDATGIFLATAHPAKFIEVVNDIIEKDVEIPARLQEVANKKKESIVIENDFEELKSYLLK